MKRVVTTQVGADGVLSLTVPPGPEGADKVVRVTVEVIKGTRRAGPFASREGWHRFVEETAGKWQGELERAPQGEFERRGELG